MTPEPSRSMPAAGPAARPMRPIAIAAAAALGLFAASPSVAAESGLAITGAWIRTTVPSLPAAGYFVLSNKGPTARTLVAASSPGCKQLMLHRSVSKNGIDRMIRVRNLKVPAHGSVKFEPGGYHLMCMSPSADVRPGRSVPVTLRFADGSSLTRAFKVYGPAGK
jgi:copper(I)-binding protein